MAETVTLDQLLEAQRRRADAQTSYFRTLLDYQRAIIMVHYRKGTFLDYNNVYLQEGPWPAKAKFDAHRLARQRDASMYINYGFTRPSVMSAGPVRQDPQRDGMLTSGCARSVSARRAARSRSARGSADARSGADEAEPGAAADAFGRTAMQRGFQWGPLGLNPDDIEPDDPESAGTSQQPVHPLGTAAGPAVSTPATSMPAALAMRVPMATATARRGSDHRGWSHAKRELPELEVSPRV